MPCRATDRCRPSPCSRAPGTLRGPAIGMVLLILLAGCATGDASRPSSSSPSAPMAATVRPDDGAESVPGPVAIALGGTLTLELPVTTGTGYLWELTLDPIGMLEGDFAGTTVRRDGAMPGSVTDQRWQLNAVAPGRTTIRAAYRRPWERDVEPARRFSVEVEVLRGAAPPPKS